MRIKRLICLLLTFIMLLGVFISCGDKIDGDGMERPVTDTDDSDKDDNDSDNNNNGNTNNNGGNSGNTQNPTVTEKNPHLNRVYRFSEEKFTMAPAEKDGIVNYLKGIGAIAADETNEENINKVLDALAYAERRQIQFLTANTLKVLSDDYTYEADYLYKIDVYKNVALYEVGDTAMQNKLSSPAYVLSVDGKTLTLKVPFSYTLVDAEGNSSVVACKSYSTLTFKRDEELKLDALPEVLGKSYQLSNYAYRFADDEAKKAFETEKGMNVDAFIALENATITESNSRILRVEAKDKLIFEKIVGNGIIISEAEYYMTVSAGGEATLYNTEKGRDDKDEADVVASLKLFFSACGKNAVVSEGTDVQRLSVYTFDKNVEAEEIPTVSGKSYKLSSYTFRFASDTDRAALESERGKALDVIIGELNATITENSYKTLFITENGKFECIANSLGGVTSDVFCYYGVIGEGGKVTLYKTAAAKDNADASNLVSDVEITVTAKGIEIATPISAGSSSRQIEIYVFDKAIDKNSNDVNNKSYVLGGYNYRFDSVEAMNAFEAEKGKTVAEILADEKTALASSYGKRLMIDNDRYLKLYDNLASNVNVVVLKGYADIADDGIVTLYISSQGRKAKDSEALVDTDVTIKFTASGFEFYYPIAGGSHVELYAFEAELPTYNGIPTVAGSSFESNGGEIRYYSQKEKDYFDGQGYTQSMLLKELEKHRRVYFDTYGRIFSLTEKGNVEWLYYFSVNGDGNVTLYNTEQGRDNNSQSDVVKNGRYFKISPDGTKLEWRMDIISDYATQVVISLDFKDNISDSDEAIDDLVYISNDTKPLIFVFEDNMKLTAIQDNKILYNYYGKSVNGNIEFYTDSDARDYGDKDYLVKDLSGKILKNRTIIYLDNGTALQYNEDYSNAADTKIYVNDTYRTHYIAIESKTDVTPASGDITTDSDGGFIIQWFEGRGIYKGKIDKAPTTAGEYTMQIIVFPTANYKLAIKDVSIQIEDWEDYSQGFIEISEPANKNVETPKTTVNLKAGNTYILNFNYTGGGTSFTDQDFYLKFTGLDPNTEFRIFGYESGEVLKEYSYGYGLNNGFVYNKTYNTYLYVYSRMVDHLVVWTVTEDCTVTIEYPRKLK